MSSDLQGRRVLRVTLWLLPVIGVIGFLTLQRATGQTSSVPFLLLFASVVLSAGGGRLAGVLAAIGGSAFIVHSALTGFGPSTLTGGPIQVLAGCSLFGVTGWLLGRTWDQNRDLVRALEDARSGLEDMVRRRTAELEDANAALQREIDERTSTEKALQASEARVRHAQRLESIGVLAGGIAHDFNNLLTSIMANAVMARGADANEVDSLLDEVEAASVRAADLCRQMLAYAGEEEVEAASVDLGEMVEETVSFLSASVPKKIGFEVAAEPGTRVTGDRAQLAQLLLNLLTNAAEAIKDVGTVRVTVRPTDPSPADLVGFLFTTDLPRGQYALIEVTDDGVGMGADMHERIFDPFFSTKVEGRGLGLAVVFGSVRAHHGAISVESADGGGTTFRVLLPLGGPFAPKSAVAEAIPASAVKPAGTVLVVDDEDQLRRLCRRALEEVGWSVETASNGAEAVRLFRRVERPSLVLLDLTMPEVDGLEAIDALRGLDPDVPIILMSGHGGVAKDRLTGPSAFIAKPFKPAELVAEVGRLARRA